MLLKAKLSNILGSISEGNIPRLKKKTEFQALFL